VGPGAAVSGQQVLSFDYNPASGQSLEFRFNENVNASGSVWSVAGVTLQNLAAPLPAGTTTTTTVTGYVSTATTYSFIRSPSGDHADIAARPMTAQALGLEGIDWSDPGDLVAKVDQAIASATDAATYFGERQNSFAAAQAQNGRLTDALEAGVGKLVDADMGRESAELQARQLRQSLAAQSLNIANASPGWLLKLFGRG
jgi:flagellin-like hook-associated protein FlgL